MTITLSQSKMGKQHFMIVLPLEAGIKCNPEREYGTETIKGIRSASYVVGGRDAVTLASAISLLLILTEDAARMLIRCSARKRVENS